MAADGKHDERLRVPYLLSGLVAVLMGVVSAGGVFFRDALYRDNAFVARTFQGQDLVTLFVAVPLLVLGLVLETRGSTRGRLVWLAMLAYAFYGYAFYVFGAAFNAFFLPYVALFGASMYALLLSVPRMDVEAIGRMFRGEWARRAGVLYTLLTAAGLGTLWTAMSAGFLVSGKVPAPIVQTGHPTGVVFALDLSIIVPAMVVAGVLLLRRGAWGWMLAAVLSVKGVVYTLSLTVSTIGVMRSGMLPGAGAELPVWAGLTVVGAVSSVLLLKAVAGPRREPANLLEATE